jgi:hypothetical protein
MTAAADATDASGVVDATRVFMRSRNIVIAVVLGIGGS